MNSNKIEIFIYYSFWIGSVLYGMYQVYKVKEEFKYDTDDHFYSFERGWLGASSRRDASDYEWEYILSIFKKLCPWLLLHIFISELIRVVYLRALPYWHCILGGAFMANATGIVGLFLVILQPVCFYCISKLSNKYCIWILNLLCLVFVLNTRFLEIVQTYSYIHFDHISEYILMITIAWTNLRCLSFSIDHLNNKCKFMLLLSFCLYLPTLCTGPFIQFEHFETSYTLQSNDVRKRTLHLLLKFFRFGFWFIFVEFCLHFVYVNALSYDVHMVQNLGTVALYGFGYTMGQFFHLKYLVFYGLTTSIATFEYIKAPPTPKCIGRIHLYSDMWKYFDVGLYIFLLKYIYVPTVGNFTTFRKLFSSMLCFCFVYIWHGTRNYIFIWAFCNYLGICVEQLIKVLSRSKCIQWIQGHWKQRLLCAIYSPLLAASCVSNFYFFAGTEVGNIFLKRLFQSNASSNLMLLFVLYCCCHVSIHVKKWEMKLHKH